MRRCEREAERLAVPLPHTRCAEADVYSSFAWPVRPLDRHGKGWHRKCFKILLIVAGRDHGETGDFGYLGTVVATAS